MTYEIWPSATGIRDYEPQEWQTLASSEIPGIKAVWADQRQRLEGSRQLNEFTEKLSREWAIETGILENLYDIERGVTETLIEKGFRAELLTHGSTNRPREFVIQLLRDQKDALDGVFSFITDQRRLSVSYIKELHAALLRSQAVTEGIDRFGQPVEVPLIKGDWKRWPNHPSRDGVTYTYCPPEQVASEMDRLIDLHQQHLARGVPPEVEAAWLHHRFTQIHPFQDGNGRVVRALASLVLIKAELFPLVVTRDDRSTYIDALESADRGDLKKLVDCFARLQRVQFAKATALSETILDQGASVKAALSGLRAAAEAVAADRRKSLGYVFGWAQRLQADLRDQLSEIAPEIRSILTGVAPSNVEVICSDTHNEHFYRSQIIENAKSHLNYFANTAEYRAWVALGMNWRRRAKLVFAFHGIGRFFNGSLICAPFLEFRDADDDGQLRATLVPVAKEGFLFFHTDTEDLLLKRFRPWREQVLAVALSELSRNL